MHSNCGDGEDLRAHWTARRSNQLVLKKINPKNSLEQLKLQLQHFSHVMQRADSLERTLILGKIQGKRRSQQQKIRWLESISNSMDMNLRKLREIWGFPGGSDGKESACNAGDPGWIPGSGRNALEKEMTVHSSVLAWRTPRTEEPAGLQSVGSPRVGHD